MAGLRIKLGLNYLAFFAVVFFISRGQSRVNRLHYSLFLNSLFLGNLPDGGNKLFGV